MPLRDFSLTVAFRRSGWQWPLREGDTVRVWDAAGLAAELPGELVVAILRHYVVGARLQSAVTRHTQEMPPLRPSPPAPLPRGPRLMGVDGRRLRKEG